MFLDRKLLQLLLVFLAVGSSSVMADVHSVAQSEVQGLDLDRVFIIVDANSPEETKQAIAAAESQGAAIDLVIPPSILLGRLPSHNLPGLQIADRVKFAAQAPLGREFLDSKDESLRLTANYFNALLSGKLDREVAGMTPLPMPSTPDAQLPKFSTGNTVAQSVDSMVSPLSHQPFQHMYGNTGVDLFLVESNGAIDPDEFTWSAQDIQDTYNRTLNGLRWWTTMMDAHGYDNTRYGVRFFITLRKPDFTTGQCVGEVCQGYEPIRHNSYEDVKWVLQIMGNLGRTEPNAFDRVRAFNEARRISQSYEQSFSAFVAYNPATGPNPANAFLNGHWGYAYFALWHSDVFRPGGNVNNYPATFAHETGHIFWACDEYGCGTCNNCGGSSAPRPTALNGNCYVSGIGECSAAAASCIMRDASSAYQNYALCGYTRMHIGWLEAGCYVAVYTGPGSWRGQYFKDRFAGVHWYQYPLLTRNDGAADSLNFNWGYGSPSAACLLPSDYFSARWTKKVYFNTGTYRFTTTTDDGVILYIDGIVRLREDRDQPPTTYTVDVYLTAGYHDIKMEYFESAGGAMAQLSWVQIN